MARRGRESEIPIYRTAEKRALLMTLYDEKLHGWPVPFESLTVATRYGKTHVVASGDEAAPPVVMLHPEATSGLVWSPIISVLNEHFRTYAIDTIGDMGRSELDDIDRYPKTGRQYSEWLDDVYQGLDIDGAHIIGGSMGGWLAFNRAIVAPDRVRTLVLLGPMGLPSWRTTLGILGPLMSLALRPTETKLEHLTRRGIGDGDRVNREMLPWLKIAGTCRGRVGMPLKIRDARLRMIKAPTLLFLGGNDGAIGSAARAATRARRTIAGCEIRILPGAGHLMMFDEPEEIGKEIVRFLAVEEAAHRP